MAIRQKMWTGSEADLAAEIIDFLVQDGWAVHQEVVLGGSSADIVATSGSLIWIIECKTTLNIAVMGQALQWRDYAHLVSIGIPNHKENGTARRFLDPYGIGIITVRNLYKSEVRVGIPDRSVAEWSAARLHRHAFFAKKMRAALCERNRFGAEGGAVAGVQAAQRWTPFKATVERLYLWIEKHPNADIKTALAHVPTHYSNPSVARSRIIKLIETGQIPCLAVTRESRSAKLSITGPFAIKSAS